MNCAALRASFHAIEAVTGESFLFWKKTAKTSHLNDLSVPTQEVKEANGKERAAVAMETLHDNNMGTDIFDTHTFNSKSIICLY